MLKERSQNYNNKRVYRSHLYKIQEIVNLPIIIVTREGWCKKKQWASCLSVTKHLSNELIKRKVYFYSQFWNSQFVISWSCCLLDCSKAANMEYAAQRNHSSHESESVEEEGAGVPLGTLTVIQKPSTRPYLLKFLPPPSKVKQETMSLTQEPLGET
jgi:hypothetical protein